MSEYLNAEGFHWLSAYNGLMPYVTFSYQEAPNLIVLMMMPYKSGDQVCQEIRRESNVPIILLTAKGEEEDRIQGIEMGADDYRKTIQPKEACHPDQGYFQENAAGSLRCQNTQILLVLR